MSHTDLGQPDFAAPRAAAGNAEFAEAEAQLLESCGYRLGAADPLAPLALDVARSFTEAGLTLHHCATYDSLCRLGGVCLLAVPPRPERARAGSRRRGPPMTCCLPISTGSASTETPTRP